MAQFYTLEEAARVLGMSPEDLKQKAQHREVRAFMDSGSWQFRVADIDELARRRGLGSDPELSLSDLELEVPDGSGSDEIDLSEFQLGTAKPDMAGKTGEHIGDRSGSSDELDVQFDDLSLPPGPLSNSSSTIIGMKSGGKLPSDSDVRLVPDSSPMKDSSDSDVRLMADESLHQPSDSDVTLVNDDASMPEIGALGYPSDSKDDISGKGRVGSSAEVAAAPQEESSSDFELTPSADIAAALQPESGSDFELTALDASDEFEATPLAGPSDSDVTAAQPSASGINLARPSDSGINLQGVGGFDLSQADSIELAPLDDDEPARPAPKAAPKPPAKPPAKPSARPAAAKGQDPNSATVMPGVGGKDPGATSLGMSEKDIFEDTDFSLEVDALDSDHDDRTVQIDRSSDFDLEESDSASEVFALDEDDVDQNAATAMGAAVADDESGEFSADEASGEVSSGWDVDSDTGVAANRPLRSGPRGPAPRRPAGRVGRDLGRPARVHHRLGLRLDGLLDRPDPEPLRVPGWRPGLGPDQYDRRPVRLSREDSGGRIAAPRSSPIGGLVVPKGVGTSMVDRPGPARAATLLILCALTGPGCAFVPKTRLDDAQKVVQNLRTQNAQLKDVTVTLKSQNQDLTQRAVDDGRSIRALEAANEQYERSIQGYQEDREQYQAAFRDLKGRVGSTGGP